MLATSEAELAPLPHHSHPPYTSPTPSHNLRALVTANAPAFVLPPRPTSPLQNYSADLLCSALAAAGLPPGDVLRVNDPRRPPFTVKEDVLPYCLFSDATRMFALPGTADVAGRRIVVATCGAAGALACPALAARQHLWLQVARGACAALSAAAAHAVLPHSIPVAAAAAVRCMCPMLARLQRCLERGTLRAGPRLSLTS